MAQDYYADAQPAATTPSNEPAAPEEDAGDQATAQIPMSVTGGQTFEPGDVIELEVVEVREDSLLVKYYTGKSEEEPPPEETPEMPSAPEESSSPGNGNPYY